MIVDDGAEAAGAEDDDVDVDGDVYDEPAGDDGDGGEGDADHRVE